MVVKKEAQRRSMELQFELPGTPEQIWQAIATGPGISCWFVPSEVEERNGGAVAFHLGPNMESKGNITVWDPPRRFAYEEPNWNGDAPPLGTEFTIEARSGGTCTVRLVHSLFTSDDSWDDQIDSMDTGWGPFFNVLRLYLTHYAGQRCASIRPTGNSTATQDEAWTELLRKLGLTGAVVGERRNVTTEPGGPALSGIVERMGGGAHYREVTLRFDQPTSGIAMLGTYVWAERVQIALSLYFYGADPAPIAAREDALWQSWLAKHFPRITDTTAHS